MDCVQDMEQKGIMIFPQGLRKDKKDAAPVRFT
jgi:hypothetical protein